MKKIIYVIILMLAIGNVFAQEEGSTQPLELPDLVIEEVEQINIKTGIKQAPENTPGLSKHDLDSLNSLEKKQAPLLPVEQLPEVIVDRSWPRGFLKGQLGAYLTPQAEAGLGFTLKDFELFANGGFEMSQGHTDNAGYQKYHARLSSDYFTPEKYWIFGGSRTRTQANLKLDDYKLYAVEDAPGRTAFDANAKLDVDGNYAGFMFETGAGYEFLKLSQDDSEISETSLNGYLTVKTLQGKHLLAGGANVDFRGFRDHSVNFIQLNISDTYITEYFSFYVNTGLQMASNYNEIDRGGFLLEGNVEYRMNHNITLNADVSTGLRKYTFRGMHRMNPYLSFQSEFDYPYDIIDFTFDLNYHPYETIGLSVFAGYRATERYPIITPLTDSEFIVGYTHANIMKFGGEGYFEFTDNDLLLFNLEAYSSSMPDDDDKSVPYLPDFQAAVEYKRSWTNNFGTKIGLVYMGARPADAINSEELDSYINLQAGLDWQINNNFKLIANFDNLLNSDIFIWNGYSERNIFGTVGILWQF